MFFYVGLLQRITRSTGSNSPIRFSYSSVTRFSPKLATQMGIFLPASIIVRAVIICFLLVTSKVIFFHFFQSLLLFFFFIFSSFFVFLECFCSSFSSCRRFSSFCSSFPIINKCVLLLFSTYCNRLLRHKLFGLPSNYLKSHLWHQYVQIRGSFDLKSRINNK